MGTDSTKNKKKNKKMRNAIDHLHFLISFVNESKFIERVVHDPFNEEKKTDSNRTPGFNDYVRERFDILKRAFEMQRTGH